MFAGEDLIGVLTVGCPVPGRFTLQDERLLGVIANQVAVGVQNARLHAFVRAGKQEWEATFDAMGDAIAVFDRHGRLLRGNAALAALPGPAGDGAARTDAATKSGCAAARFRSARSAAPPAAPACTAK